MEMVKRQGDRISELEAQLRSDKPSDAKPAKGKFMGYFHFVMLTFSIECLCWNEGSHDFNFWVCKCVNAAERVLYRIHSHKIMRGNYLLSPATKLGQGYVFTCVCDSVHRGGVSVSVPGISPSGEGSLSRWVSVQYIYAIFNIISVELIQNTTIEERVSLLEIQVVEIEEDLNELDEDVGFLFNEQIIQDERLFSLEQTSLGILEELTVIDDELDTIGNELEGELKL